MPFEAAQARKDPCLSCLSKSAPTNYTLKCKLFVNADSFGNFRGSICQYFEALSGKKIQTRTAHDRSYDRMIDRSDVWAFPYQYQLAFFKANTSAKKSKVFTYTYKSREARMPGLRR